MNFLHWTNSWTLIFPVIVLLYYFFRKRYSPKTISSTLFWESVMNETKVSPYIQQLQRNILLLLQLLALLLFVWILMQPYIPSRAIVGEEIILVADTSSSMLAMVDDESWFDQQKKEMNKIVDQYEGASFTLIQAGNEPSIILKNETNAGRIKQVIRRLSITYEQEQLDKSMTFTNSILSSKGGKVFVFSDTIDKAKMKTFPANSEWHFFNRSKELENVSIRTFSAIKRENEIQSIAQIVNDSNSTKTGTVVYATSQKELKRSPISLHPGEEKIVPQSFSEDFTTLDVMLEVKDEYEEDNVAQTILSNTSSKVAVDDTMHETVGKAFTAIGADVISVPVEQLNRQPETTLLITSDESILNDSNRRVLLFGRQDESTLKPVNGKIEMEQSLFSTYVHLDEIYVAAVQPAFSNALTVAAINGVPFIQQLSTHQFVVLSPIEQTDWPMHPSFPLFLWDVLQKTASDEQSLGIFLPNEKTTLSFEATNYNVFTMNDDFVEELSREGSFIAPAKPGAYKLTNGQTEKSFVVQLEQNEKQLSSARSFTVGEAKQGSEKEVKMSLIPIGICLILLFLLLEWEVQRRRGFTN